MHVVRPVVRSFDVRFAKEAAAHVRGGGHALIWSGKDAARLAFQFPRGDRKRDLGYWSLLDLEQTRYRRSVRGPLRGLAVATIAPDSLDIVRRRAERDSVHPGATRAVELDCATCAACCRDNEVILEKRDLARFEAAGRAELGMPPYTRRDGNRLVLRLLRSRDCRHLGADKRCAIYAIRPGSCRDFPVGSESCLFAREVEHGLVDGARD